MKDAELFADLDIQKWEKLNGTEPHFKGIGSNNFIATDNQGRDDILELGDSL